MTTFFTGSITLGQTVLGSLGSSQRYRYSFQLDSLQTLRILLDGRDAFDSYLRIYDGSNSLIAFNDDGGGNRDSLISSQFAAGSYTLEAGSFGDWGRGSYALSVISLSGPPPALATNTLQTNIGTNTGATPTIASGGLTRDRTVELSGTVAQGFAVKIYDGQTLLSTSTSGGASWQLQGSTWRYTSPALEDGLHTLRAEFTKTGATTQSRQVTVEVDGAIIGSMSGTLLTDQGTIGSGEVTTDHTLGLSGFAEPGADVMVYDGTRLLGRATLGDTLANGTAPWSFTTPFLADGRHVLAARITDQAGNTTTVGNLAATVVTGNVALGETINGALSTGLRQQYRLNLDSEQVVRVFLDGRSLSDAYLRIYDADGVQIAANDDGGGNLDSLIERTFAAGAYTVEAASFGDYGSGTFSLSLSTNSLSRSVLTNAGSTPSAPNGGLTKDNTLTLSGTRTSGTVVSIYDGDTLLSSSSQGGTSWVLSGGQWRYTTDRRDDGVRTLKARFGSGSTFTEQSLSVTVDTAVTGTLSQTVLTDSGAQASTQSGGSTTDHTLGLSGTAEINSVVQVFDGATLLGTAQLNEGNWTFLTPVLRDGLRSLTATITDAAGNVLTTSAVTVTLSTVDTQAPTFVGGASRQVSVAENTAGVVYTPSASDNVDGTVSRFEFAGGADDSRFNISATTGAISFKVAPDYEAPLNANNVYVTRIRAKDAAGNAAVQEVTVNVTDVNETSDDSYSIEIIYEGDATYRQYFVDAARRWSTIIKGDLPNVDDIDDLRVHASVGVIDGPGGTAANANATGFRSGPLAKDRLAYEGEMTFDITDIQRTIESGVLPDIVFHELGHVLGFSAESFQRAGLLDPDDPLRYVGQNALSKYRTLAGVSPTAAYVPLEDTGGPGTRGDHWNEALFGNELMSGYLRGAVNLPISSVTIGAMQDLGYQVDYSQAESFNLATVLTPGFGLSAGTVTVAENFNIAYSLSQWQVSGTVEGYEVGGSPDARFFRVDEQGRVFFRAIPDFEKPQDVWGSNEYRFNLYAQTADNKRAILPVTVFVTNEAAPSSAEAFSKWQEAEQRAAGDQTKSIQAYNQYSAEVVAQRDNTTRDGSANQSDASKRLAQWVDRVTGTDIVSEAEYREGFVITGKALPGKKDTIQFLLDNDRTDGIEGKDYLGFRPGSYPSQADISYDNATGDWRVEFAPVASGIAPAAGNVFGSGVHQLVVDNDGNDRQDAGEASRLFLVANGTAAPTDTGSIATNYSVQDKITGDVFVYYFGDPDGAGVGMSTLLDYRTGTSGTDTAANPGVVILNRDGSSGGGDADYYSGISAFNATAAATANNMALRFVTQISAQTWEFHMGQKSGSGNFDSVNAKAADHAQWGSNTSRMASLQEMVALYAANFSSAGTVGAVQPISNASAIGTVSSEANQPRGWAVNYFSAAPTPTGHALVEFNTGLISDFRDSLTTTATLAVL